MDNQYTLTIKLEDLEDDNNLASSGDEKKKKTEISKPTLTNAKATALLAWSVANNLGISKVGEFRRDSLLQQQIDAGFGVVKDGLAFAVHPVLGIASTSISIASQLIDYEVNVSKETSRLGIMRERAGFMNRSR